MGVAWGRGGGAAAARRTRAHLATQLARTCRVQLTARLACPPCSCVLAARSMGAEAERSFLDDTFLADRVTTVRAWLEANPSIFDERPPPALEGRYSG